VLYPADGGIIRRGEILVVSESTVAFTNGEWAYIHELNEDVAD
jgi:hypothetical protein